MGDISRSRPEGKSLLLTSLTPHGKGHINSTFFDNLRMLTLSRGIEPLWMNDRDAADAGIADNDWVELYNDHGVVVTRAVVSARLPRKMCMLYHSPERTISVTRYPLRGDRGALGHHGGARSLVTTILITGE